MFAVLWFLLFSASHVHHTVNGFPANPLVLPQVNKTDIAVGHRNDTLAPNTSELLNGGYHYAIPKTQMTIHITVSADPRPLSPSLTLQCLHSFIQQLGLFRPDEVLARLRYVVLDSVQATLSPSKSPESVLTYRSACKVIAGLWYYISRERLMYELRFGVFASGRMIAWGMLEARDEPPSPSTPPKPLPIPTAVQ